MLYSDFHTDHLSIILQRQSFILQFINQKTSIDDISQALFSSNLKTIYHHHESIMEFLQGR